MYIADYVYALPNIAFFMSSIEIVIIGDYTLTSWHYFIATAVVYVPCFLHPWLRKLFEYGIRQKAQLHLESNGFIRITIPAAFRWRLGQHCFLRFISFGLLQALSAHPFTICSLPVEKPEDDSHLVFYIRHQGGFTARLLRIYRGAPGRGSGVCWTLPFTKQFLASRSTPTDVEYGQGMDGVSDDDTKVERHNNPRSAYGVSAPRSLRVILAIRDTDTCKWFDQAVSSMLDEFSVPGTLLDLHIQVHLTSDEAGQQPTQSQQAPAELKEQGSMRACRDIPSGQAMLTMVDSY
ncbi:hypothetical protein CBS147353_11553 [Aspergillus niger]|nr:hypothetical protein CBS147353_11553 [Aspergillus niger]